MNSRRQTVKFLVGESARGSSCARWNHVINND